MVLAAHASVQPVGKTIRQGWVSSESASSTGDCPQRAPALTHHHPVLCKRDALMARAWMVARAPESGAGTGTGSLCARRRGSGVAFRRERRRRPRVPALHLRQEACAGMPPGFEVRARCGCAANSSHADATNSTGARAVERIFVCANKKNRVDRNTVLLRSSLVRSPALQAQWPRG